ncbi:RNase adapter RapZ [Primorskyibacter sp. S187A]|uniref:RNase adapter RapZ n=1 Tax=Primorskyibacter sp. S187A TaxID=3415130 RepID=UPI003C7CA423
MSLLLPSDHPRLVLVTGPSGAGRSTALNALEDLGFEAIDNIPLRLIPRLFDRGAQIGSLALGIDVRNRDFSVDTLSAVMVDLANSEGYGPELLYLDAPMDVLLRRYSETRRRHPLAPDGSPQSGIEREMELLAPLRAMASRLIETNDLSPHDLRSEIQAAFGIASDQPLVISINSFSYKRGLPRGADLVFDCRFLLNPHWQEELRAFTGQNEDVVSYIATDDHYRPFLEKVTDLLLFQFPAMMDEGKAHALVAFGCTGGKHRSVAVAEAAGSALANAGWRVSIRHRELDRRAELSDHAPEVQGSAAE